MRSLAVIALVGVAACGGGGGGSDQTPTPPSAVNNRPTIAAITDATLSVGETLTLRVSISDADFADAHTLTANSEDACVAPVTAAGTTLSISALVVGATTITVTAIDDSGADNAQSPAVTFNVAVKPVDQQDWALPRTAPVDVDIETCPVGAVLDHIFADRSVQAALLLRDGQVIGERYAEGYGRDDPGTSWSVAKSFYSAAIGIAIDEGAIAALEQKASDFLTEWIGTAKEDITIRHLLEMRAGLPDEVAGMLLQDNQTQFALERELVHEPGTTFLYSNTTSQLFEPLILRSTGTTAHQWLTEKVLRPIGIDTAAIGLWLDASGENPLTFCCIDMRPDDFARFGLLYLNDGMWNGLPVVSAPYVAESLVPQSAFYGLQWWVLNENFFGAAVPIDVPAAIGLDGQRIYLWREENIALVVLTKYQHFASQGYIWSLSNWPNTCTARNSCPDSSGGPVPSYDERALIERLAQLRGG